MIEIKLLVSRADRSGGKIAVNHKGDVIKVSEREASVLVGKNQAEYVTKPKTARKTRAKKATTSK